MTQLIVSLEDTSKLADIKRAIRMLKGVVSVKIAKPEGQPNATTIKAMAELETGNTTVCEDYNAYLKLVSSELPD